jgi:predicted TIM-barrel fold metal-dependent hydrolase
MTENKKIAAPALLNTPLPALDDPEGDKVPQGIPAVVDAHVHLFPDDLFPSIWGWFEKFGWPIRYRLPARDVLEFLFSRGIRRVIGLQYAHKPGIARRLNAFMAGLCGIYPGRLTGLATVFPGEANAAAVLEEAFALGLSGVKLHAHVQCFDVAGEAMQPVYEICRTRGKPLIMHAGREPKSPAYNCDPHLLCSAGKLEQALRAYPGLKICVPHLGADEFAAYASMIERYDTLWLDTTMALADYLPGMTPPPLAKMRPDRILYGTDFPNIPYAWDRELRRLCAMGLAGSSLERILCRNAADLFGFEI